MTLVQWTPFKGWHQAFPNFARPERKRSMEEDNTEGYETSAWVPATDIYNTQEDYVVKMEVPGFSKDDIKVEFKKDTLIVRGEKKVEVETEGIVYHRTERAKGGFSRSFHMPPDIDGNRINAKLKNGILELRIPKPEEQKPKSIPVNFN